MRLAKELGITKKELEAGQIRLPSYRALYVDHLLKEGSGVALYRDRLFKAVIRGIRSVEDSSDPLPEALEGVLREYQKTGYRWMKTLDQYGFGGILADDMGLGKRFRPLLFWRMPTAGGRRFPALLSVRLLWYIIGNVRSGGLLRNGASGLWPAPVRPEGNCCSL